MKHKILIIVLLILSNTLKAQGDLYIIFDENLPIITKDIGIYFNNNQSYISNLKISKGGYRPYTYFTNYPLYGGYPLEFEKKEGTTVQTIPISEVATYDAFTFPALYDHLLPLAEEDYYNPLTNVWGQGEVRTVSFFDNHEHIYLIELDHANNQAYVVEVEITSQL